VFTLQFNLKIEIHSQISADFQVDIRDDCLTKKVARLLDVTVRLIGKNLCNLRTKAIFKFK